MAEVRAAQILHGLGFDKKMQVGGVGADLAGGCCCRVAAGLAGAVTRRCRWVVWVVWVLTWRVAADLAGAACWGCWSPIVSTLLSGALSLPLCCC
jgi:hypothetical protein